MVCKVIVGFSKEFLKINKDEPFISLKSKSNKWKADKEIIMKLAKHFDISSSLVQIKSGHESQMKIIEIS